VTSWTRIGNGKRARVYRFNSTRLIGCHNLAGLAKSRVKQSNEPGRNTKALAPTTCAAMQRMSTLARNEVSHDDLLRRLIGDSLG
jgi:hypothetical protein